MYRFENTRIRYHFRSAVSAIQHERMCKYCNTRRGFVDRTQTDCKHYYYCFCFCFFKSEWKYQIRPMSAAKKYIYVRVYGGGDRGSGILYDTTENTGSTLYTRTLSSPTTSVLTGWRNIIHARATRAVFTSMRRVHGFLNPLTTHRHVTRVESERLRPCAVDKQMIFYVISPFCWFFFI